MQQIIEEIDMRIAAAKRLIVAVPLNQLDLITNETSEVLIEAYEDCKGIVIKYMQRNKS